MSLTPVEVIARIPESFDKAQAAGDLLFFPSTIYKHTECDVDVCRLFDFLDLRLTLKLCDSQFEIRLCPALQQKPQLPTPHFSDESKLPSEKPDPFAPPYTPTLYLGDIKDEEEGLEYVVLVSSHFTKTGVCE